MAAKEAADRTSGKTAQTYLNAALPFFTWLEVDEWQQRAGNRWDAPPEQVRQAMDDYLIQKLRCRVRPHKYGFQVVEVTGESRNTIRVFLSGLKLFYGVMVSKGYYPFSDNPLVESVSKLSADALGALAEMEEEAREFPRMSPMGGTEEPRRKRRLSDSYFRIHGDEWLPQIVDWVEPCGKPGDVCSRQMGNSHVALDRPDHPRCLPDVVGGRSLTRTRPPNPDRSWRRDEILTGVP